MKKAKESALRCGRRSSAARHNHGGNAKQLDAFVYGPKYFGARDGQELTAKFGRQTLLRAQSLLLASDGISAGWAGGDDLSGK